MSFYNKEGSFQFSVDDSYERIWSKHIENPALQRVTDDRANLSAAPLTVEEERFVLLLLNHLTSTLKAIKLGLYEKPEGMELDVISFYSKPVPRAAAQKYFEYQTTEIQELLTEAFAQR